MDDGIHEHAETDLCRHPECNLARMVVWRITSFMQQDPVTQAAMLMLVMTKDSTYAEAVIHVTKMLENVATAVAMAAETEDLETMADGEIVQMFRDLQIVGEDHEHPEDSDS